MNAPRVWAGKRGRRLLVAVLAVLLLLPLFAAFEAHPVNVKAHIENALRVEPKEIDFGIVFPQESLEGTYTVGLSESFMEQDRVTDVFYRIVFKPKPDHEDITPFITHEKTAELDPDTEDFGDLGNWWREDPSDPSSERFRDIEDIWHIDFYVPCIVGAVGQDYEGPIAEAEGDYGTDIWVEVFGLSYGKRLHKVMVGDRRVPVGECVTWTFYFVVKNDFDYPMTDVEVTDRFGAQLDASDLYEVRFVYSTPGWSYVPSTNPAGTQDRFTWSIDSLSPGDRGILILDVSTGCNPAEKQEYTEPGDYVLNSGAVLKWRDALGVQHSESTDELDVTAFVP